MIHFDVTVDDGDRTLTIKNTGILVGWVEKGRDMTNLTRNWTEWRFTPAAPDADAFPVRESISAAYEDARTHAATLLPADE